MASIITPLAAGFSRPSGTPRPAAPALTLVCAVETSVLAFFIKAKASITGSESSRFLASSLKGTTQEALAPSTPRSAPPSPRLGPVIRVELVIKISELDRLLSIGLIETQGGETRLDKPSTAVLSNAPARPSTSRISYACHLMARKLRPVMPRLVGRPSPPIKSMAAIAVPVFTNKNTFWPRSTPPAFDRTDIGAFAAPIFAAITTVVKIQKAIAVLNATARPSLGAASITTGPRPSQS